MLQLLFTSYDLELKTDTLDVATVKLMNGIETVKNQEVPDARLYESFYDDLWSQIDAFEESTYKLSINLNESSTYKGLFDIHARVYRVLDNELILKMSTKHYYQEVK
jgi:hypothetical protein